MCVFALHLCFCKGLQGSCTEGRKREKVAATRNTRLILANVCCAVHSLLYINVPHDDVSDVPTATSPETSGTWDPPPPVRRLPLAERDAFAPFTAALVLEVALGGAFGIAGGGLAARAAPRALIFRAALLDVEDVPPCTLLPLLPATSWSQRLTAAGSRSAGISSPCCSSRDTNGWCACSPRS